MMQFVFESENMGNNFCITTFTNIYIHTYIHKNINKTMAKKLESLWITVISELCNNLEFVFIVRSNTEITRGLWTNMSIER